MSLQTLTWNKSQTQILQKLNLESHGLAQKVLDNIIVKDTDPYVPMDTGTLAQTVRGMGTGEITYIQPYAHYQYYGTLYVTEYGAAFAQLGEKKPVNTGIPLNHNKEKHPLAGPFWFEVSKSVNKDKWIQYVQDAVRGVTHG